MQDTAQPSVSPRLFQRRAKKYLLVAGGVLAGAAVAIWGGLQVKPGPLATIEPAAGTMATVPLPDQLPAPVERFYRTLYGDEIPVIEGASITGRGTMRISGITFPVRFEFAHNPGMDYLHMIEVAFYDRTIMTINETYFDGSARLDLPFGESTGPNIDQGANLAMWAEAIWMPALWLTDPRVRWEAVDDTTARLIVPFEDREETFTVFFSPNTGLLERMESMRFKGEDDTEKTLWINNVVRWDMIDDRLVPASTTLTWADEESPWAKFDTDAVIYATKSTINERLFGTDG